MDDRTKELVQMATALAVGCTSCLELSVPKALELGASQEDLQEVLQIVRGVKLTVAMKTEEIAEKILSRPAVPLAVIDQPSTCGCAPGGCC